MADSVKVNFALEPETVESIERLAQETHRSKSNVIEWLVADAVDRMLQVQRESVSVDQTLDSSPK